MGIEEIEEIRKKNEKMIEKAEKDLTNLLKDKKDHIYDIIDRINDLPHTNMEYEPCGCWVEEGSGSGNCVFHQLEYLLADKEIKVGRVDVDEILEGVD